MRGFLRQLGLFGLAGAWYALAMSYGWSRTDALLSALIALTVVGITILARDK